MKSRLSLLTCITAATLLTGCASRHIRTAKDITPGHCGHTKLDWTYGANDIRIQTSKLSCCLMDRWFSRTHYNWEESGRPRILITDIDNRTDMYISTDMIRDIFEGVAVDDGRFSIVVGNHKDARELDRLLYRIDEDSKYDRRSKPILGRVKAPQFLAKVRITKATTRDHFADYEEYRMTMTLYDVETQEVIDSSWDVLKKRVSL